MSRNHNGKSHSVGGFVAKGMFKLIMTNPLLVTIVLVLLIAFIAYTLYSADYQLNQILKQYQSLSARQLDSRSGFNKRLFYITIDNNGNTTVTVGYKSEVEEEIAKSELDNALGDDEDYGGGGHTVTLNSDATAVRNALLSSPEFSDKADSLALTYQLVMDSFGNLNAAIGLMANVANEGNYGVVEHSFSKEHKHGFRLPSGGVTIKTKEDIQYLLNWDSTTNTGTKPYKGSCGVGSVQWSYGRRIAFLNVVMGMVKSGSTIDKNMWMQAESTYMLQELVPGGSYYTTVSKNVGSNTVEDWAEAFCDYYERPGGCCPKGHKMSHSGSACVTRRATAGKLATLLEGIK